MSVIYLRHHRSTQRDPAQPAAPTQDVAALHEVVIAAFAFGGARSTVVAAPMYHTAPNTQFQLASRWAWMWRSCRASIRRNSSE